MSTTGTWKCPHCGYSLEINYDWLAEHGGPLCEHCQRGMALQPGVADNDDLLAELSEVGRELLEWASTMGGWEAKCWSRLRAAIDKAPVAQAHAAALSETIAPKERIEALTDKAEAAGLRPEDLDDIVHELAASIAADVNNGGLEEQIVYLIDGLGAEHAERQLNELIEERKQQQEE
jgi:hypothetical protein